MATPDPTEDRVYTWRGVRYTLAPATPAPRSATVTEGIYRGVRYTLGAAAPVPPERPAVVECVYRGVRYTILRPGSSASTLSGGTADVALAT